MSNIEWTDETWNPVVGCTAVSLDLRDRKGGDMTEWPHDLRVREWPEEVADE